jgi:hypothetical protein
LLFFVTPGESWSYHWFVTGLAVSWAAGAAAFHRLSFFPKWRGAAIWGWAGMGVLLFTVLLVGSQAANSPLLVGYLLLITGAALRSSRALVWMVTLLSAACYNVLVCVTNGRDPSQAISTRTAVIFTISLVLTGLIVNLLLRNAREAAFDPN